MPQELELDWKEIHPDFNEVLKEKWIKWFEKGDESKEENVYQRTRKWIKTGLTPTEAQFAKWLENKNYVPDWKEKKWGKTIFYLPEKARLKTQYLTEWGDVHFDFITKPLDWEGIKTYQQLWKSQGFTKQQVQQYLKNILTITDFMFLTWLRDNRQLVVEELSKEELESLKIQYQVAWTKLDDEFAKKPQNQDKTYQQIWEGVGLSYQEAQEWIKLGLVPSKGNTIHHCLPWSWMKNSFTLATTRAWIENDLKGHEFELATELQKKNYHPNTPQIQEIIEKEVWGDLHPEFTYLLRRQWEKKGLTKPKTQEWIIAGFSPKDYNLVKYWKVIGAKKTKEWLAIGFNRDDYEIVQQWKTIGNSKEIKVWLSTSFAKNDYEQVKSWKDRAFIPDQVQNWLAKGWKKDEAELAAYFRDRNYRPEEAIVDKNQVQHWLDYYYPLEATCLKKDEGYNSRLNIINNYGKTRTAIIELVISHQNLTGELNLTTFPNLEELYCANNQLTKLILPTNNKIRVIEAQNNLFTTLDYDQFNLITLTNLEKSKNNNSTIEELETEINELRKWEIHSNIDIENDKNTELTVDPDYSPNSLEKTNYPQGKLTEEQIRLINKKILDEIYPNKNVKELKLSGKKLKGHLDLSDYPNLELLNCSENELTSLKLINNKQLTKLNVSQNQLTNLGTITLLTSLTDLNLGGNKELNHNLTDFSQLVNLETLELANTPIKGSLAALQSLTKLKTLDIRSTNIDRGLEYLPNSLEGFDYSDDADFQVQAITKEIFTWGGNWKICLKGMNEWKSQGFAPQQAKEWIESGLAKNEWDLVNYLEKERNLTPQLAKDKLTELRSEYSWWQKGFNPEQRKEWIKAGFHSEDHEHAKQWKNHAFTSQQVQTLISVGFRTKDYQEAKKWKQKDFSVEQIKEWISAKAEKDDHDFVAWLRDIKQETSQWITNYQVDYQILSERFKKYGLCEECQQPNTGEKWCKACNVKHSQSRFSQLNQSGNTHLDAFIRKYQLAATEADKFIEWIPYEQFIVDSEPIGKGGFGEVYKAQWPAGNIQYWDQENKQWCREKDAEEDLKSSGRSKIKELFFKKTNHNAKHQEVVLKILANSQNNLDFLQETEKHKIIDDWFNNLVPCYGISRDPKTKNYLMVMQYLPERDLRSYLKKINEELKTKLIQEKKIKAEIENLQIKPKDTDRNIKQKCIEKKQDLDELINFVEKKIRSTSLLKRNERKINLLLKNLPNNKEEFLTKLDKIKKGLSEKLTIEKVDKIYQTKLELTELDEVLFYQNKQQELSEVNSEIVNLQGNLQTNKFNQLVNVARGLKDIHQKNLVHRDFHSGNILKGLKQTSCLITDLGLCKPADQISQEEKIFGVIPYVAPEVLQSQPYTQASDVYSFGIVTYELLTGLPPHYNRKHDVKLGLEICQGLRPNFNIKIPQLLENLINRCWANDPTQRPIASEIEKTLRAWQREVNKGENTEFQNQLEKAEAYNQTLPIEIRFPNYQIHYGAVYTSQLLPTKEITKLLREKIEVNDSLIDDELKWLVKDFMQARKEVIKDKENEELDDKVWDLEDRLKAKGLSEENIRKAIKYCEKLIEAEREELEKQKLEANIEIPTNK